MQTVGRESRYFSMETRQDLLRLESAWHRAVCHAVSSLRVITCFFYCLYNLRVSGVTNFDCGKLYLQTANLVIFVMQLLKVFSSVVLK